MIYCAAMIRLIKHILPKEKTYHIAVSMGVDSVAALFWLRSKGYNLVPLHFNHNMRAQNGTMHEKFFELCHKLGLQGKSDIGVGLRTESECRNARLSFYNKEARDSSIITAHHLNDWIESYLLNCFRGHPNHRPFELETQFESFKILHPFLLTRKRDFREYLERNGWMDFVVEDQTNWVVKGSRRNWVRNAIIPEMTSQKMSLEKFAQRKINKLRADSSIG